MPELPEVETVRRGLDRQVRGVRFIKVDVLRERAIASPADPGLFRFALECSEVGPWERRGKYLLSTLLHDDGSVAGRWGVHLRMTGQFLWLDTPSPPCRHTRVRLHTAKGEELRFVDTRSFGQMWWVPPGVADQDVITGLKRLGPEPLGTGFDIAHLSRRLQGSRRPIKSALLDQALVAGVGNIYADESLFSAGIHPLTPAGKLGEVQLSRIREALVKVLELSIGAGGTTFSDFRDLTGTNGNYGGMAWVYRRTGQACRCCGTPIRRERVGGRSTHWCPTCQP